MAEAFLPNVAASQQKKIINITSTQGSISRSTGGGYFYRSSKAALNMVMHSLAIDLKPQGITVGLVSPGFVRTDFTKGIDLPMMITPEQSATAVIKVIDGYDLSRDWHVHAPHGRRSRLVARTTTRHHPPERLRRLPARSAGGSAQSG